MGDARRNLDTAINEIINIEGCKITAQSRIYETEPQELKGQPWFMNQVVQAVCDENWEAASFLKALMSVENKMGRKRDIHFGPRIIDLDLLLFGDQISALPECIIPHPKMLQRAFVLVPLCEIAPYLTINRLSVTCWLDKLNFRLENNKIFQ